MNAVTKADIARLRAELDALEQRLDGDDFGPAPTDEDIDAFIVRNHDMFVKTARDTKEFLAQGSHRVGTAAEHLDYFLEKFRRSATKT